MYLVSCWVVLNDCQATIAQMLGSVTLNLEVGDSIPASCRIFLFLPFVPFVSSF